MKQNLKKNCILKKRVISQPVVLKEVIKIPKKKRLKLNKSSEDIIQTIEEFQKLINLTQNKVKVPINSHRETNFHSKTERNYGNQSRLQKENFDLISNQIQTLFDNIKILNENTSKKVNSIELNPKIFDDIHIESNKRKENYLKIFKECHENLDEISKKSKKTLKFLKIPKTENHKHQSSKNTIDTQPLLSPPHNNLNNGEELLLTVRQKHRKNNVLKLSMSGFDEIDLHNDLSLTHRSHKLNNSGNSRTKKNVIDILNDNKIPVRQFDVSVEEKDRFQGIKQNCKEMPCKQCVII